MITLLGVRTPLIGQRPLFPTGGRVSTADRLRLLLHMTPLEFEQRFPRRANVNNRKRGRSLVNSLRGRVFVLGRESWRLLGLTRVEFFDSIETVNSAVFTLLPHPSGRNLLYNDPRVRKRMRDLLL